VTEPCPTVQPTAGSEKWTANNKLQNRSPAKEASSASSPAVVTGGANAGRGAGALAAIMVAAMVM